MKLAQLLLKALTGIGDDLVEEAARPALPRPRWLPSSVRLPVSS